MRQNSLVELKCGNCEQLFLRPAREHKRNQKKGREIYCSLSCLGHRNYDRNYDKLKPYNSNGEFRKSSLEKARLRVNEMIKDGTFKNNWNSPFKYFIRKANARAKKKMFLVDIDIDFLMNLWDTQKSKCALSGLNMILDGKEKSLFAASLDRIDSSKGYIRGNVQFVCLGINYAKNSFLESEIKQFIQSIKNI